MNTRKWTQPYKNTKKVDTKITRAVLEQVTVKYTVIKQYSIYTYMMNR